MKPDIFRQTIGLTRSAAVHETCLTDRENERRDSKMKYSMDTYKFYSSEKNFSAVLRTKVRMKEDVEIDVLRHSVNTAIKRYPYFSREVVLGEDGGYDFIPNTREVTVIPTTGSLPLLCSDEVNRHLLFVDCEGRDIYFNISHVICGGKGSLPWIMTNVYQYVVEKYHVLPDAPGIRKVGSPLLEGEDAEPSIDLLSDEKPIYEHKSKKPVIMAMDYLNGMYNPFLRHPIYYVFSFEQNDIVRFIRNNDSSVAAFFLTVMARALDRILPEKYQYIGGEVSHNPCADIGLPNAHVDLLTSVNIDYDRKLLKGDMEKLGTITRSQIMLQTDPSVVHSQLRKIFTLREEVDQIRGLKNKIAAYAQKDPSKGKDAEHGTFISNYSGYMDWGEVADYVEYFVLIVDGHLLLEVSSLGDRIFVSFMQLIREKKYVDSFTEVLRELEIPFTMEGPYSKNLTKHKLPKQ